MCASKPKLSCNDGIPVLLIQLVSDHDMRLLACGQSGLPVCSYRLVYTYKQVQELVTRPRVCVWEGDRGNKSRSMNGRRGIGFCLGFYSAAYTT